MIIGDLSIADKLDPDNELEITIDRGYGEVICTWTSYDDALKVIKHLQKALYKNDTLL